MSVDPLAAGGVRARHPRRALRAGPPLLPGRCRVAPGVELPIGPGRRVLDLAAGTGKLTRLLVPLGAEVVAVEPLAAMRSQLAAAMPTVEALDGSAEAVPLADASVDAVTVAQAFHWFDAPAALDELARVLRPAAARRCCGTSATTPCRGWPSSAGSCTGRRTGPTSRRPTGPRSWPRPVATRRCARPPSRSTRSSTPSCSSTGWRRAATSRRWSRRAAGGAARRGPCPGGRLPAALPAALRLRRALVSPGAPARRPDLGRAGTSRPPVAAHPRPVGDPRQRGDAPADAGGPGDPRYLAFLARFPTVGGVRVGLGGRGGGRVGGPRATTGEPCGSMQRPCMVMQELRRPVPARRSSELLAASRRRSLHRPGACWPSPSRPMPRVVDTNVARVLARVAGRRLTPARGPGRGRCRAAGRRGVGVEPGDARPRRRALPAGGAPLHGVPARAGCAWRAAGCPEPDPASGSAGVSGGQSRFDGSDRQGRGRLVAALRHGPVSAARVPTVMGWPDDAERAGAGGGDAGGRRPGRAWTASSYRLP